MPQPGGSLGSTWELSREHVHRLLSTHPGASGLSTFHHVKRRGIIIRGKEILTFSTLGEAETLSEGMLLPFFSLHRSLGPMGTGCDVCSRPPGGAREAGSLSGPHAGAQQEGPTFHHSDIFTPWYFWVVHFSLEQPNSLVKMLCCLQKAQITPGCSCSPL